MTAVSTICGIPVGPDEQIEPHRLGVITEGRRIVPLRQIKDHGVPSKVDFYVPVVVTAYIDDHSHQCIEVSDLRFSGSCEMRLSFGSVVDNPNISYHHILHMCLLVMNPSIRTEYKKHSRAVHSQYLHVDGLISCVKLGTVKEVSKCMQPDCAKPIIASRDGSLCFRHASENAGVRVSIGGAHMDTAGKNSDRLVQPVKQANESAATSEQIQACLEAKLRGDILAKKKTAVMLLNRNSSGGHANAQIREIVSDQLDFGEQESNAGSHEKIKRFQELKRKRELVEKRDKEIDEKSRKSDDKGNSVAPPETELPRDA